KNGTIVTEAGITISAPYGNVVLEDVIGYVGESQVNLAAADHSLHFEGLVAFYDNKNDEAPVAVNVEAGTHVVVEPEAEVVVDKLVVTENFAPAQDADAAISLDNYSTVTDEIEVEGNVVSGNEISTLAELVQAAQNGGAYKLVADVAYTGQVGFAKDAKLDLNGHTLRSTNNVALSAISGATLVIEGNGNVIAQEACVMAFDGSEVVINGGTYTAIDNFVFGTNGTAGRGNNIITINEGTFNGGIVSAGYIACGVYVANNDIVYINGGTFNITNGVGILARSGNTTVGEDVVINATGNGAFGKVGDAKVTIPTGEKIVLDKSANYPGGVPTLTNNSSYTVYTKETIADVAGLNYAIQNGGDYTLTANVVYSSQASFAHDTRINLNGKKLQSTNNVALSARNGATLILDGNGYVEAQEMCVMAFNGSTVIINGGTYTAHDNAVFGTNGTAGQGANTLTINAGTFNGGIQTAGYVACGIYVANSDTVVVNGGTFNITNGVGILARSGSTTVGANVVINATGNGACGKVGDSQVTVPAGEKLVLDLAANYPAGDPTLTNNTQYKVCVVAGSEADMNYANTRADANKTVFGASFTCNGDITYDKDMTLDLNGKTITFVGYAFEIRHHTLTMNGNGGAIVAQEACLYARYAGKLIVNGGTYTSYDNFVIGTNGTAGIGGNEITINAGTFNGGIQTAGYVACGIYVANDDTVVVNGGTFNITNGVGILARCGNTTVGANVVINATGNNELGRIGDSRVVLPAGQALVLDNIAGYPAGSASLTNNSAYTVHTVNA
ncbi:MAG: hypothetical protein J6T39_00325, partial [Clostridia bacterium]|nr:hypothetical protein [Clostridia bacterium]